MYRLVCLEAHNHLLANISHFLSIQKNVFATSNIDLVVSVLHKIYSMQRILIHIKANPFVKYGTQSMQWTWWPVASTTIVTGSYYVVSVFRILERSDCITRKFDYIAFHTHLNIQLECLDVVSTSFSIVECYLKNKITGNRSMDYVLKIGYP